MLVCISKSCGDSFGSCQYDPPIWFIVGRMAKPDGHDLHICERNKLNMCWFIRSHSSLIDLSHNHPTHQTTTFYTHKQIKMDKRVKLNLCYFLFLLLSSINVSSLHLASSWSSYCIVFYMNFFLLLLIFY